MIVSERIRAEASQAITLCRRLDATGLADNGVGQAGGSV